MKEQKKTTNHFKRGLNAGIPIGLGYFSVSFAFGIMAVSYGMYWWQAVVISMTTVTSAGQFAGIGVMIHPGQYIEMLLSQITINVRYAFMSVSLSQKTDSKFRGIFRWLLGFMMTDEIFAVASAEGDENGSVSRSFFVGLSIWPWLGWTLGTLLGALLGNILPNRLMSALGIAIYGMFVAIVVPEVKKSRAVVFVVVLAVIFSCLFYYVPVLSHISSGLTITICSILAAVIAAIVFPLPGDSDDWDDDLEDYENE